MPLSMKIGTAGEALIRQFEGYSLTAYRDGAGVLTVGIGHTQGVKPGQKITPEVAESFYLADTAGAVAAVNHYADHATQNQFDAMVDFCFNLGAGAFESSTLLRLHNAGDYAGAAEQFARWDHAGGKVEAGLDRRRAAEAALYSKV